MGWENSFTGESDAGEEVLDCPECDGKMHLIDTRTGRFYGCENYPECQTTHGCHPDGSPLGIPANKETREIRMEVHRWFDPLWMLGKLSRGAAYRKLQSHMHMNQKECHVGRFTREQCEQAIIFAKGACKIYGIDPDDVVDKR